MGERKKEIGGGRKGERVREKEIEKNWIPFETQMD